MITTLLFDIGGVLVQTTNTAPREKWERALGLPAWGLSDVVFNNDVSRAAFVGAADAPDVWRHVARELQLDAVDASAIARDFWIGDSVNAGHIALIESLRGRFKLGILSNAWHDMRARDASRIDFGMFDEVVYSCEEKLRKPDPAIYARALKRLGSTPEETLFIDDFVENIEAARAVGLRAIWYQPSVDLPAAIAAMVP